MIAQSSKWKYSEITRWRVVTLFLALGISLMTWPAPGAERGELAGYSNLFESGISSSVVDEYLAAYGMEDLTPVPYDVAVCRVLYWTLDAISNNMVLASGALQIPLSNGVPLNSSMPLVMYAHGTESYRWNVPSCPHNSPTGPYSPYLPLNSKTIEALAFSSAGYCVFAPDYAGLGFDTNSLITPYLIADREPIAVIDGLRASRDLAAQINLPLNGRIFLAGYSQGGHVCLATHRMIDQEYAGEFRITAAAPASAPADLTGSLTEAFRSHLLGGTTLASFTTAAYQPRYRLWNDFNEVFLPAYVNVPNLFYGAAVSLALIAVQLPPSAQNLFTTPVIQQATNPASRFGQTIASNNVYQWRPNCPIKFFYAGGDTTVSPSNSLTAYAAMQALGADVGITNVGDTLNHATGFGKIQAGILRYFDQYRYAVAAVAPADLDGDGLADIIGAVGSDWYVWFSRSQYLERSGPYNLGISGLPATGDIDCDGLADLISVVGSNWYVWFASSHYLLRCGPYDLGVAGLPVTGDIDDDGKADLISVVGSKWYVWFSSSDYLIRCGPYDLGVAGTPVTGDIDNDGRADLITVTGSKWYLWFSSSDYLIPCGPYDLGVSGTPATGDLDDDGLTDLITVVGTNWHVWFASSHYLIRCGPYPFSAP